MVIYHSVTIPGLGGWCHQLAKGMRVEGRTTGPYFVGRPWER